MSLKRPRSDPHGLLEKTSAKRSRSTTTLPMLYGLPSGEVTGSRRRYDREWVKLARAVAQALDCSMVTQSPDIYLETKDGVRFQLPLCVALKVVELANDASCATTTWVMPPWRRGEDASV